MLVYPPPVYTDARQNVVMGKRWFRDLVFIVWGTWLIFLELLKKIELSGSTMCDRRKYKGAMNNEGLNNKLINQSHTVCSDFANRLQMG